MPDSNLLQGQIALGFKRVDVAVQLIQETIWRIGELTQFPQPEELRTVLELMRGLLVSLIHARAIQGVEIGFRDELFHLDLIYAHPLNMPDELDLSALEMVPVRTQSLEIRLLANQLSYATFAGFDRPLTKNASGIHVALVEWQLAPGPRLEQEQGSGPCHEQERDPAGGDAGLGSMIEREREE